MKKTRQMLAFEAARKGDLKKLMRIVRTAREANWKRPENGYVLLDAAVESSNVDTVRFLLTRGANPNTLILHDDVIPWPTHVLSGWFFSPFASAIKYRNAEIVQAFIEAGADLNLPFIKDPEIDAFHTCRDLLQEDPALRAALESLEIEKSLARVNHPSKQTCRL